MPWASHDDAAYTDRLLTAERGWKRWLGAQRPYRANVRRIVTGRVLEIGCGTGRLLGHIGDDAVGVDTNPHSVRVAVSRGLNAMTPEEFRGRLTDGVFDTLLFSHVLEHMTNREASRLVADYLGHLAHDGRVVVIVPQEAGFRSDPTHVEPVNRPVLERLASDNRLVVELIYSFPFPRPIGRVFRHNETVALLRKTGSIPPPS
ncbi:MAG: class I SAM-dependent methyltransferase [Actinobacteria bacterium]|nr:class I SAM-dependent methyltransferase [Actinomycetota bacterium]